MAQADWKRYYGIVMFHPTLGRTFVNGIMYADRDEAHEQALLMGMNFKQAHSIGVVGVRGKTPDAQRALWFRSIMDSLR